MPLPPPITDIEELKNHPAVARLVGLECGGGAGREVRPRRDSRSSSSVVAFEKLACC